MRAVLDRSAASDELCRASSEQQMRKDCAFDMRNKMKERFPFVRISAIACDGVSEMSRIFLPAFLVQVR
jgi:hypothetical protein